MIQRSQTAFETDLETPVKRYRTLIMICLNIRITTMGQIAMASGMKMKAVQACPGPASQDVGYE